MSATAPDPDQTAGTAMPPASISPGTDTSRYRPTLDVGATRRQRQPQALVTPPQPASVSAGAAHHLPPGQTSLAITARSGSVSLGNAYPHTPSPDNLPPVRSLQAHHSPQLLSTSLKMGLMIASLTITLGLIGGGIWLGTRLMLNPNQVAWLNRWLPDWTRIPIAQAQPSQTLADIHTEIRQVGLIPGDLIPLTPQQAAANPVPVTAWLLPIFSPTPCPASLAPTRSRCDAIVELRVYQTVTDSSAIATAPTYRRVHQLMVAGPAESFVLASLLPSSSPPDAAPPGSNQPLPLTDLRRFEGTSALPGVWFSLSGQRVQDNQTCLYGQVLYYNPDQLHLSLLAPWVSPANQFPTWQEVTAGKEPELVVNQTIDLEPKLVVYQLRSRNFLLSPWELAPIPLTPPALNGAAYQQGIKLAQVGLWSPALQQLEHVKPKSNAWTDLAQAQMDLIKLHARITTLQAEQTWVSTSEQVLAHLLDGRWQAALAIFDQSATKRLEIANLLQTDPGRIWRRLQTALTVTPDQVALQTWGALFMQAQRGYEGAIAWVQQQRPMDATREATIRQRLDLLQAAEAEQALPSHFSQIIGSVTLLTAPNPNDWLHPDTIAHLNSLKETLRERPDDQIWYRIQVLGFHDGQRWQQPPFSQLDLSPTTAAQQLWRLLGLNTDAQVQLVTWQANEQQQVTLTKVKAVRFQNGQLELLALGAPLPSPETGTGPTSPPLALTGTAAQLLLQPPTLSLADLYVQDALKSERLFTALWKDLQRAGKVPDAADPQLADWLPWIGHWQVQQVPLTDRRKMDTIFRLGAEELAVLKALATYTQPPATQPQPRRTVILSSAGHLIYSEFTATPNQQLLAIAALNPQETAYLLVSDRRTPWPLANAGDKGGGYRLLHWSPTAQGFR